MRRVMRRVPAGVVSVVVVLAAWQWSTNRGLLRDSPLPTPGETLASLWEYLSEPVAWLAVVTTVLMALVGLVVAVVIAVPAGLLAGASPFAFRSSRPVLDGLRVIPPIIVIPAAVLAFGPTFTLGVFMAVFANVFALTVQVADGARAADPVLMDTLRAFRRSPWVRLRYARVPAAVPYAVVGIRMAAGYAFVASTVAGVVGGAPGLGRALMLAEAAGMTARVFAIVLLLGLLGAAVATMADRVTELPAPGLRAVPV